jgi:O-antigen/teichoic acid export membrane protein
MLNVRELLREPRGSAHADRSVRRSNLLRLAVFSSGMSKLTAVGLQGLAIPLVYHALGTHQFALYLLLTAALASITLLQFGAGPGLTQAIARAHAQGDTNQEGSALASAFAVVTAASALGGLICVLLVRFVPAAMLFGASYSADQALIIYTANAVVLVMALALVLGVVDSAFAGYQEQIATNLGMCVANVVSTVALIVLCRYNRPTIVQVMLVLYGGAILSRFVNLIVLLVKRPYLLRGFMHMNRRNLGLMMHTGVAFWLIQATGVLEQHGGTYLMAHLTTPQITDIFGVIFRAGSLISATVGIFTQPLWPAFTDAVARHDSGWVHRAARKIRRIVMSIAGALALLMITIGTWGIEHVWRVGISGNRLTVVIVGVYILFNLWTHYHYVLLMGLDRAWTVAGLVLVENLSMLVLGMVIVPHMGASGMAVAYLLASALLPAWILPHILSGRLNEIVQDRPWASAARAQQT